MTIKIALGDSSPMTLSSFSELFEQDKRFSLVSTANTAEALIGAVIRVPVDICVLSWDLPAMGGKRTTETLRELANAPRIVIYGNASGRIVQSALFAGAAGFCAKQSAGEDILSTCSAVAEGKMMFPYLNMNAIDANPLTALTRRELVLLEALSEGLTNNQLAKKFEITTNTVKFHLSNIYEKLGASNRAKAIAIYLTTERDI